MKTLNIEDLKLEAQKFCELESQNNHKELIGVTDGKAVGSYIEKRFKSFLEENYSFNPGNSGKGIDLPDPQVNTDIKVTSIKQPQSSCPFKVAKQKIYGLGYNLLVFVYEKIDTETHCSLKFKFLTFIEERYTADYCLTTRLINMLKDGASVADIVGYFNDINLPGDDITYNSLAEEVLRTPPLQGQLTISNALQWRLNYNRAIKLNNTIAGITNYEWK